MAESASGKSNNQQQQHHHLFTVGSEVEVSIDEEGFTGAWFRATILKLPTNSSPSKKKEALIEYKTLVTEDGSGPLKEHADIVSLRPVPPDIADKDFEEGDVVDSDDKDGWWTGVVHKILENDSYSVFFESPLHVIDFERNKLRMHQDWVDGKWVRPQKMDVSLLADQLEISFKDANLPEENVQAKSTKNVETNIEKEILYSINSRNDLVEQPSICNENTAVFAWTSNKKKRKLSSLSCNTRVSHPSKKLGKGNLPKAPAAIAVDELRKTGRKTPSRKTVSGVPTCNRIHKGKGYLRIPCDNDSESTIKVKNPGGEKAEHGDRSGELDKQGTRPANDNGGYTVGQSLCAQVTDKEGKDGCNVLEITPKEVCTTKESEMNNHLASEAKWMAGSQAKNSLEISNEVDQLLKTTGSVEKNLNDQAKEKGTEFEQLQASGNSQKRKRGRPRKLMLTPKATGDKEQDGNWGNNEGMVIKGCISDFQVVYRRNGNELSKCKTQKVENNRASSNVDDDDRPLLMWSGGMQCLASINASRRTPGKPAKQRTKGSEQVNTVNELGVVDGTSDLALVKNQGWPFVKNSPVWTAIDSLEVFKLIPQMPHFHPLKTYKEECREGLAIGNMVTFASLVEKISKLQFDNPRHIFESTLDSLFDLEQQGFDISLLCNRVNDLLAIKVRQVQYRDEIEEAESKILEYTREKTMLAEEMETIEKAIAELKKKHASIKLETDAKDHEITRLKSCVDPLRESIQNARFDFEKQAALPLKGF